MCTQNEKKNLFKIAVCDDNDADTEYISSLLQQWSQISGHSLKTVIYHNAESFLFDYADHQDFDILLLDIEMGKIDGVTMAKKIRKDNEYVQIIFITGFSDYISEGYEVSALHYLLKPLRPEKLFEVLERAVEKVHKNEHILILNFSDEIVRIPFYEIIYLEVNHNYVTIHAKKEYTVKKTLGEFENELDERFYRMGRSFILNLNYISRVTKKEVYLSDGSILPLPRGQYEPLNRAIILRM